MKCSYYLKEENEISCLVIEKDKAFLCGQNNEKQNLNVSKEECFNTLISLYAIKRNWTKEECVNPVCKISFGENEEVFSFNVETLPDNYPLFMGFISKLVGDVI